jgi:outer membrane protein OmpA-like peptidoglycan-associated protein
MTYSLKKNFFVIATLAIIYIVSTSFVLFDALDVSYYKKRDDKQSKKDALSYFKSINNESSITILPGDVSNLSFITTQDLTTDEFLPTSDLAFITQNIYFNNNSSVIPKLGINQLEGLASFLIENSNVKVNITCYADSRGNITYNKLLSEQRSDNIRIYLLSNGVMGLRVVTESQGENNPIIDCETVICDEQKHAKNRRAELKIIWN